MTGPFRVALASVTRNRNLRVAQFSSFAAWSGEYLFITTTTVYAFERDGAKGAALISFLRVLPSAMALPVVGALADRFSRRYLLIVATLLRALAVAGAAIAAGLHHAVLVYVLVTLSTVCHAAYRPTLGAMLPSLCTSVEDLAGSNAVRSVLDGLAALVGPLLAAALLAAFSPAAGFAAVAALSTLSLLLIFAVRYRSGSPGVVEMVREEGGVLGGIADAIRELIRSRHASTVIGLGTLQCVVRGALTVFAVVVAVDLTGMGNAGVGILWAGFGVGGLVAAFGTLGAAGSSRLGTILGTGVALWGLPLIVCGLVTRSFVAVAAFTVIGAANALVDVSGFTLLQRVIPDHMLTRVLALAEAVFALAMAVGSLIVPPIDSAVGHSGALIAVGCVLPAAVALAYTQLRHIDLHIRVSSQRISLLRRVGMLRLLPVPAIESLARSATMVRFDAGVDVVRQGESGDDFYVIESGRMSLIDEGRVFGELGPGDSFGELALLRSVPRTITVRAAEAATVAVVDGARFVAAISGFSDTASAAQAVMSRTIDRDARRRGRSSDRAVDPLPEEPE